MYNIIKKNFIKFFFILLKFLDLVFRKKKKFKEFLYSLLRNNSILSCKIDKINELNFFSPNYLSRWRVQTLFTKEADTIDWINNFDDNCVFWDIGANIGIYSLYAAKIKNKINVVAFEPSPHNFTILTKNISLNKMTENIIAIPNPLDQMYNNISYFRESDIEEAGSKNTFDNNFNTSNYFNFFKTLGFSIDYLTKNKILQIPTYIKIDVDGNEKKIIKGANNTLDNKILKSLLIESDSNDKNEITSFLEEKKFNLQKSTITSKRSGSQNLIFIRK
jgi:FkbM family methyltransferase